MSIVIKRVYIADALIVAAVLGSIGLAVYNASHKPSAYACEAVGTRHRVELAADSFSKQALIINRCDTVTIENQDSLSYNLNFGERNQHAEYPGYRSTTLLPDESITIDAFVAGKYTLHDHFRDNAKLSLDIRELRASD